MKKVYLSAKKDKGRYALVDDEDYEMVSKYKWHTDVGGYAVSSVDIPGIKTKKKYRMHRMIMNPANEQKIDHVNHDRLDNRKENLRTCTVTQNTWNSRKPKTNKSGFIGVHYRKDKNKYEAYIWHNSKKIGLGYFVDAELAARAYNNKALELRGEWAVLNGVKNG